jgi:putative ABC transport system permease protein
MIERLRNNFKSTIRILSRDKIYLLISTISLSIGVLSCLFIARYVTDELSYDRFHTDFSKISRIETTLTRKDGRTNKYANLEGRNYKFIKDRILSISQINEVIRFATYGSLNIEINEQFFSEQEALAADSSFFNFFSFRFLRGNRKEALSYPNSAVITKALSEKYFGSSNAIGKSLLFRFQGNTVLLTITGILENIPETSHFLFNIVTSKDVFEKLYKISINEASLGYSYLKVINSGSTKEIEDQLNLIYTENKPADLNVEQTFSLRPIQDIHLKSSSLGELSTNSDTSLLYIFSIVGAIILGIASFNFSTLTIAKSIKRANEIGMRKIFGAQKQDILTAFVIESGVLTILSICVAYLLIWFFLPYFNLSIGKSIAYSDFFSPLFFIPLFLFVLIVGLTIGLYPAFLLYKRKLASLLKKKYLVDGKKNLLWKGMIIAQFSISIVLTIATYVIQNQIDYVSTRELGFNKEQIITFPNYFDDSRKKSSFVEQLKKNPHISKITFSSYVPGTSKSTGTAVVTAEGISDEITFNWIAVDDEFFDLYGINVIEGRNFSRELSSDSTQAFVINETAKNILGWDNPLNKKINSFGRQGFVIGVVQDFNFLSLYSKIPPMIFVIYDQLNFTISAKLTSPQYFPDAIAFIENEWTEFHPGVAFSYKFVDDEFEAQYESEKKAQSILTIFSALALIIAFLGLFSFISYLIEQKTHEIGIRKVLGATIFDILKLFYGSYLRLFLISILISVPIVIIVMQKWLSSFYYRINIKPELILIPLTGIFLVFVFSISVQVTRGVTKNPIDSIKTE